MRFIHCADLHIGSKMDSKYPPQKAQHRRQELRNTFVRLVEEAEKDGIDAILISGDAFDSDHPGEKDLEYFYGVIASHPDMFFFYLRGNHDIDGYGPNETLSNLFTFNAKEWTSFAFEEEHVTVSGIEITKENADSFYDAPGLVIDPKGYNIVMLHGQVGSDINLKKLAHRNIQYVALGHIHSFKLLPMEDGGIALYPGILEPRGFDETGEKGYILLDTEERKYYFQPFSKRTVHWEKLDISRFHTGFEISSAVKKALENSSDIYRIELVGERDEDVHIDIESIVSRCKADCFLLDIRDETTAASSLDEQEFNTPLIKEFLAKMEAGSGLSEEEKTEAIRIGLNALAGKEF